MYVRYADPATISELQFEEIEESYRSQQSRYVTGVVRARELQHFFASPGSQDTFVAELPDGQPQAIHPSHQAVPTLN